MADDDGGTMSNAGVMEPHISDRGFARFDPIPGWHDDAEVQVTESSNAEAPCVWLGIDFGVKELAIQLDLDGVERLRDQLDWFVNHHYQRGR